jgi:predicted nucleotidyltransferase
MVSEPQIALPRQALAKFCRRNHIRHLGLFGSVLRDDFRPDSDVDVLVEFEPGTQVSVFTLVHVQDELSALLGRTVDMGLRHSLKPAIRDSVLASEQVLYSS